MFYAHSFNKSYDEINKSYTNSSCFIARKVIVFSVLLLVHAASFSNLAFSAKHHHATKYKVAQESKLPDIETDAADITAGSVIRIYPDDLLPSQEGLGKANVDEIVYNIYLSSAYKEFAHSLKVEDFLSHHKGRNFLSHLGIHHPKAKAIQSQFDSRVVQNLLKLKNHDLGYEEAYDELKGLITHLEPRDDFDRLNDYLDSLKQSANLHELDNPILEEIFIEATHSSHSFLTEIYHGIYISEIQNRLDWEKNLGIHTGPFQEALATLIKTNEQRSKGFANHIFNNFKRRYEDKASPGAINPDGNVSLSDGHHGLRTAYDLKNIIKSYDSTRDLNEFFVKIKVNYNFLHPHQKTHFGYHYLDLCADRRMYFGPETRADIIRSLMNLPKSHHIIHNYTIMNKKLLNAFQNISTLEARILEKETKLSSTPASSLGKKEMQKLSLNIFSMKSELIKLNHHVRNIKKHRDRFISLEFKKAARSKFAHSIADISNDAMRAFIGAVLPNLSPKIDSRTHRIRISNDFLVDYAEFYIGEWLVHNGFEPIFTAETIQLDFPRDNIETDHQLNQKLKNYLKTLTAAAHFRHMIYGNDEMGNKFKDLLTRLFDQKKYDEKCPRGSDNLVLCPKTPMEEFEIQKEEYRSSIATRFTIPESASAGLREILETISPLNVSHITDRIDAARTEVETLPDSHMKEFLLTHPLLAQGTCLNPLKENPVAVLQSVFRPPLEANPSESRLRAIGDFIDGLSPQDESLMIAIKDAIAWLEHRKGVESLE